METKSNSTQENKGNPKVKKTNNLLSRLREEGDKNAQMITGTRVNTANNSDVSKIEETLPTEKSNTPQENENLVEKIENVIPKVEVVENLKQSTQRGIDAFTKERKKEKEVVMAAVSRSQRDELKLVAVAFGIGLQDLIANIFENFLEENQVEIKKAKKKLLG